MYAKMYLSGKTPKGNGIMLRNQKLYALFLAAAMLAAFAGCNGKAQPADATANEVSIREAVTEANPQAAVDAVYDAFPDIAHGDMPESDYRKQFADVLDLVKEYYIQISSPNDGLGDLLIFKPAQGEDPEQSRDQVREALHQYKEKRAREFENYDILDAYSIARDSVVYDQGEYIILVMFSDNEAVQDIIDDHIPL